jgi:ribosomal protein L29
MNVRSKKIKELEGKLIVYKEKLANEMIGYRGVVHESSASEIKHDKVMVLKDMVRGLEEEIFHLKHSTS